MQLRSHTWFLGFSWGEVGGNWGGREQREGVFDSDFKHQVDIGKALSRSIFRLVCSSVATTVLRHRTTAVTIHFRLFILSSPFHSLQSPPLWTAVLARPMRQLPKVPVAPWWIQWRWVVRWYGGAVGTGRFSGDGRQSQNSAVKGPTGWSCVDKVSARWAPLLLAPGSWTGLS